MVKGVFHGREHDTLEAKARWFQSLTLEERMDVFCQFMDADRMVFVLSVNPRIAELKHAQPIPGRVRVLSKAFRLSTS